MAFADLLYCPQSPRSDLESDISLQCVGEETFVVDIGEPRPTCFLLGKRYVVSILFCLALEQTKLSPFEW